MKPYKPISCDYVDYIEHLATTRAKVSIQYLIEDELTLEKEDYLVTWKNESGEEYLYTKNGLKIRFDRIVNINGKPPSVVC